MLGAWKPSTISRSNSGFDEFSIDINLGTIVLNPNLACDNIKVHGTTINSIFTTLLIALVHLPNKCTQVFDELIDVLPVPESTKDFSLTLGDLLRWLSE